MALTSTSITCADSLLDMAYNYILDVMLTCSLDMAVVNMPGMVHNYILGMEILNRLEV